MKILLKVCRIIDNINDRIGRIISLLVIPLILLLLYEVILRYIFNSPTYWSYETVANIMGYLIFLGAGYTLLHKKFVAMDAIYNLFPRRFQALIDLITSAYFFIMLFILIKAGTEGAIMSLRIMERSQPPVYFPLYILRVALPLGAFLLGLQGLSKFIKDFLIAFFGKVDIENDLDKA